MRNLFKRKEPEMVQEGNYPAIVEQIHNEFNTAGENLLEEANKVLEQCKKVDKEKGKLLSSLGFENTPQAMVVEETMQKEKLALSVAETVKMVARKYPFNKFITEDIVKQICKKYNLVFGDVSQFKGFVPQKNLDEITRFLKNYDFNLWIDSGNQQMIDMSGYEIKSIHDGYSHFFKIGTNYDFNQKAFQKNDGVEGFYSNGKVNGKFYLIEGRLLKAQLQICAPIKDMDTKGYKLQGHKLIKDIPDPVVLQPIENGYLIVTAWGDEASDPLITNEITN